MSARRFVCVHAHFYQPPRKNPWLEAVEVQDSARPYHDWNERVTDECYAPNRAARILDQDGRIPQSSSAEDGVWLESYRGLGEALGVRPRL